MDTNQIIKQEIFIFRCGGLAGYFGGIIFTSILTTYKF